MARPHHIAPTLTSPALSGPLAAMVDVAEDWDALEQAVECVRLREAVGDPAPEPPHYDERYRAPAHRKKLLETTNGCERDARIRFLEAPHIYLVDDAPVEISVTSVVGEFMSPFDADRVIAQMAAGRRESWPRLKYALDARPYEGGPCESGRLTLLTNAETGKTLWTGAAPAGATEEWAIGVCAKKDRTVSRVGWYHFERAMTTDEIKRMWSSNGLRAGNMGTECHLLMELWSNSEPARRCPELRNGLTFLRDVLAPLGVRAFRTEWEVFTDASIGVAGSIDWVGQFPDGSLCVVDWKRTGPDKHDIHDKWGKSMGPPLSHLDETDVCKFALQLSMYAYILRRFYGFEVRALALCSIHPDHRFHTFVPYLEKEVAYLCARRRVRVAAKARAERERGGLPRCEISGQVAWDPVRVGDLLCDAKHAAWRMPDAEAIPDEPARAAIAEAEAELSALANPTAEEVDLTRAVPWKMRIPAEGWTEFTPCAS